EECYCMATCFNAAAIPSPKDFGVPTPQKCMKNSLGCSVSMWLCPGYQNVVCPKLRYDRIYLFRSEHEITGRSYVPGICRLKIYCLGHASCRRHFHSVRDPKRILFTGQGDFLCARQSI